MYNEEELERGVELMTERGLPIGRMIDSTDRTMFNAIISTIEDGPFWYGDLIEGDVGTLMDIAKELNRELIVHAETMREPRYIKAS